jgi:hypothetical protein
MKTSIGRVRKGAHIGISTDEGGLREAYAEARLEWNAIEQERAAGVEKMLSTQLKAQILARVGVTVPSCPTAAQLGLGHGQPGANGAPQQQATANGGALDAGWRREVEILYAQYSAARAAKSLRESEEARQLVRLRRANDSHPGRGKLHR